MEEKDKNISEMRTVVRDEDYKDCKASKIYISKRKIINSGLYIE